MPETPLTNANNLRVVQDENGYLLVTAGVAGVAPGPLTNFGNMRLRTDENGYLMVAIPGGTGASPSGDSGDVQYNDGSGGLGAEAAFNYDAANNRLKADKMQATELELRDSNLSHVLRVAAGSDLSADRLLSLITGDAARTVTLSGDPTLSDWFDQAVKQASSPTFAGLTLGYGQLRQIVAAGISGDFTTTSNSMTNVTNASIQITTGASAQVIVLCTVPCKVSANTALFDWKIGGSFQGTIQGVNATTVDGTVTLFQRFSGLSATTHTIQLGVRNNDGSSTISILMSSIMAGKLIALEYRT